MGLVGLVGLLAGSLAFAAVLGAGAASAAPVTPDAAARAAAPAPTADNPLLFGLATPDGLATTGAAQQVTTAVGRRPDVLVSYADFTTPPPVDAVAAVARTGARALVTWEPWKWGATDQAPYSPARIAAGGQDSYLRSWASAFANAGVPVMIRFAHEMNGTWYPWSGDAATYVQAWRHVHDVFAAAGAQVTWIWSPNVPFAGSAPMAAFYPGASYVDVVALDGHNLGTTGQGSTWQAPRALFATGLQQLRSIAPGKPIVIGETASAEQGGSKAAWIGQLVSYLSSQPDVAGFVWFDVAKEADWRVTSSPSATAAMKKALAGARR